MSYISLGYRNAGDKNKLLAMDEVEETVLETF